MRKRRTGTLIMLAGVVLAVVAAFVVLGIVRQANAERVAQVKQVLVVMAARDIPDGTAVAADELAMQPFPADFVPQGAIAAPEQAVGKYTTTQITKGQIVLANQLSATLRAGALSLSVPAGKVAVALPMTDLMSADGAIKAGDHVDVLLTLDLKEIQLKDASSAQTPTASSDNGRNPVTQITLQDVEVAAVGQEIDQQSGTTGSSATSVGSGAGSNAKGAVILLVDPQDALVIKYAKDSGGVVDLALVSPNDTQQVKTDPVTIDQLFSRFNFKRPGPVP